MLYEITFLFFYYFIINEDRIRFDKLSDRGQALRKIENYS